SHPIRSARTAKAKYDCDAKRRGLNEVTQNLVDGQSNSEHQRKDDHEAAYCDIDGNSWGWLSRGAHDGRIVCAHSSTPLLGSVEVERIILHLRKRGRVKEITGQRTSRYG